VVGVSGNKLQDGGGGLVVLTFVPYHHPFSLFFLYSIYTPISILQCPRRGWAPAMFVCVALWLSDEEESVRTWTNCLRLDVHGFNSAQLRQPRSTFHKMCIMLKIILYTLLMTRNIAMLLHLAILCSESHNIIMLFQSC
jgi:hypothetical protein